MSSPAPAGALDRWFSWLASMPEACLDDNLSWRPRMLRAGDIAEVSTPSGFRNRVAVIAATPREFKLADGRVFDQRGWPTLSGAKSRVRARKAAP